jgi:hypothetical protein
MYGTVMIGKIRGSVDDMQARVDRWRSERGVSAGHIDTRVLVADDNRIIVCVRFNSKEEYEALSDDPRQDEWWRNEMMPLLDGDPEWVDGEWRDG